jgi:hypothetical protein
MFGFLWAYQNLQTSHLEVTLAAFPGRTENGRISSSDRGTDSSYALKVVVLMRQFDSQLFLEGSTNFVCAQVGRIGNLAIGVIL